MLKYLQMALLVFFFLIISEITHAHIDTSSLVCNSLTFRCGNGQCIPWSFHCDGSTDCYDNSDEMKCGQPQISQCDKQTEFTCVNGGCVKHYYMCNGHNDCGDNSDELYCHFQRTTQHHTVPPCNIQREYTCANRRCLSSYYVCNGVNDCGDNSDEVYCNKLRPTTSIPTTSRRTYGWITVNLGRKKRNR